MIYDLGNKKGVSKDDSSSKLMDLQNILLTRIVETLEKNVSHYERNIFTRKVCTSSLHSSSEYF